MLRSVEAAAFEHREDVILVLKFILPRLQEGLERQRGSWMGFGATASQDARLLSYESEKLRDAPINNISSEQAVGQISYGLKRRGAKELSAASRDLVTGASIDLLDRNSASAHRKMREHVLPNSDFMTLKSDWTDLQEALEAEAFAKKQNVKISHDQTRNKDLEFLKSFGGPFTSIESLDNFVQSSILEKDKQMRLYIEVRFAKYSSITIKRDEEIFRLIRNHRKLNVDEYARNLRIYLGKVSISTSVTMADFKSALCELLED